MNVRRSLNILIKNNGACGKLFHTHKQRTERRYLERTASQNGASYLLWPTLNFITQQDYHLGTMTVAMHNDRGICYAASFRKKTITSCDK